MADTQMGGLPGVFALMRKKNALRITCESCDTKKYCTGANHKDGFVNHDDAPDDFFLNLNKTG